VLILDEPTDGLDPNQKHEVRTLIHDMAPTKAIIISTHILEEVDAVCTRAAIIAKGKLLFVGTPAELAARSPKHNAVSLTLPTEQAGEVANQLGALPGVLRVEASAPAAGRTRLTALARDGGYLFDAVQAAARDRDWPVAELYVEPGHLDDVFRVITMGAQAPGEVAHS
jgi:ABC-2 type transport system ATP-binding protein